MWVDMSSHLWKETLRHLKPGRVARQFFWFLGMFWDPTLHRMMSCVLHFRVTEREECYKWMQCQHLPFHTIFLKRYLVHSVTDNVASWPRLICTKVLCCFMYLRTGNVTGKYLWQAESRLLLNPTSITITSHPIATDPAKILFPSFL